MQTNMDYIKCSICHNVIQDDESYIRINDEYVCDFCIDCYEEEVVETIEDNIDDFYIIKQPIEYYLNSESIGDSETMSNWNLIKELKNQGYDIEIVKK